MAVFLLCARTQCESDKNSVELDTRFINVKF